MRSIRTPARPPKFIPASTRRRTRHVIAPSILLYPVLAVGTLLRVLIEPLYRLGGGRAQFLPVVVVAAFCAEATSASLPGTCDASVAHVLLGDYRYRAAFAV